ncbi:hypothetical protein V9L05_08785 [Bernardetia sp. Wsw4-3y2]|uniref:hypothetical protein n=1 Tax=Bernardetia sp. Wsw4-3y2 TaxID=3127471 RepID=UPI0030D10891
MKFWKLKTTDKYVAEFDRYIILVDSDSVQKTEDKDILDDYKKEISSSTFLEKYRSTLLEYEKCIFFNL